MKRRMIQHNMIKNAIAAYFSAIEIHNKPRITYRYETVTLLMTNAWELVLKAYVYKHIGKKLIYENKKDGHTIKISDAIKLVEKHLEKTEPEYFKPIAANIRMIEKYRNEVAHYYCESLEPFIFMIVAKSTLNFAEFVKKYFAKDILEEDGLYILPVGFKLPFKPEEFFMQRRAGSILDFEAVKYVDDIVEVITSLNEEGIDESIVVGFDVYMEKIKKVSNGALLVSITSEENADVNVANIKKVQIVNDKGAQRISLSEDELFSKFPYSHDQLKERCKEEIPNFVQNGDFYRKLKIIKADSSASFERRLRPGSSSGTFLYNENAITMLKEMYKNDQ